MVGMPGLNILTFGLFCILSCKNHLWSLGLILQLLEGRISQTLVYIVKCMCAETPEQSINNYEFYEFRYSLYYWEKTHIKFSETLVAE